MRMLLRGVVVVLVVSGCATGRSGAAPSSSAAATVPSTTTTTSPATSTSHHVGCAVWRGGGQDQLHRSGAGDGAVESSMVAVGAEDLRGDGG